jgi:hypothetical protein
VSSRTRSRCLRTGVRDLLLLFAVPPRIRRNNPRTVFHPPSPCHARPWLSSRTRSRCLRTGVRDLLLLFRGWSWGSNCGRPTRRETPTRSERRRQRVRAFGSFPCTRVARSRQRYLIIPFLWFTIFRARERRSLLSLSPTRLKTRRNFDRTCASSPELSQAMSAAVTFQTIDKIDQLMFRLPRGARFFPRRNPSMF